MQWLLSATDNFLSYSFSLQSRFKEAICGAECECIILRPKNTFCFRRVQYECLFPRVPISKPRCTPLRFNSRYTIEIRNHRPIYSLPLPSFSRYWPAASTTALSKLLSLPLPNKPSTALESYSIGSVGTVPFLNIPAATAFG